MSKIQPIYLQCEDLHCKADLKLHRKKKKKKQKTLASLKMIMPKLRGQKIEEQEGEGSG